MGKNIEYGMVELGLPSGLKWADRNVGAETTEAYGDYFMWGSTEPDTDKPCYSEHAPFNDGQEYLDEAYFNAHKSEWLYGDVLKPEYDAAHAIMGDGWRMPTQAEMQELLDGTTWSAEKINRISGMRFTSNVNGNSIFMPFAGRRLGSDIDGVGNLGYAWSSSLDADDNDGSHGLDFYDLGGAYVDDYIRCDGFAVRGVHG